MSLGSSGGGGSMMSSSSSSAAIALSKRYASESFAPASHPYAEATRRDRIHSVHYVFFPKETFRYGAIGFRDVTQIPENQDSGTSHSTLLQFLGEALRFVPRNGSSPEERKFSYTDNRGRTVPKLRILMHLLVKNTKNPIGIGYTDDVLPDEELMDVDNQLGFMLEFQILDPKLKFLNLIVGLIGENAKMMPEWRQDYVAEEIAANKRLKAKETAELLAAEEMRKAAIERDLASRQARRQSPAASDSPPRKRTRHDDDDDDDDEEENASGGDDDVGASGDDSEVSANDVEPNSDNATTTAPSRRRRDSTANDKDETSGGVDNDSHPGDGETSKGRGGGEKKKTKKKKRTRRHQVGRPGYAIAKDPLEEHISYRQIDQLHTVMALLIDLSTGNSYVTDRRDYRARHVLESAIIDKTDPNVDLSRVLSLENVIERVRQVAGNSAASEQLDPKNYTHKHDALEESDLEPEDRNEASVAGVPYYKVPVPKLVWEFHPEQLAARRLAAVAFPWKRVDPGMTLIAIAAREMNVTIDEILNCVRTGAGATQFERLDRYMTNAGYVSTHLGLRPSAANRRRTATGAEIPNLIEDKTVQLLEDDEVAMYQNMGHEVSISATRKLGKSVNVVKTTVEALAHEEIAAVNKTIARLTWRKTHRPRKRTRTESGECGTYDDDERDGNADFVGDEDASDEELTKLKDEKKAIERRRSSAIAALSAAASENLLSLMDPTATVPDSIKGVYNWLVNHNNVSLPFVVKCRNLGTYGQILTAMMAMLKMRGIATNQWPIVQLSMVRDTGYLAHIIGRVAAHMKLLGSFGGGKTDVMKAVMSGSVTGTVIFATGTSSQGVIPIYGNPNNPDGYVMIMFDELPRPFTAMPNRMKDTEEKAARIIASLMTSGKVIYYTVGKNAAGELGQVIKVVYANMVFAGATNSARARSVVEARMIMCYLTPAVPGPRNAANLMCQDTKTVGVAANNKARALLCATTHHALTFMTCICIEVGALPVPCSDRFRLYMEVVVEYITKFYPDLLERIRLLDVAHTFAAVDAVWNAVVLGYAPGYSSDRRAIESDATSAVESHDSVPKPVFDEETETWIDGSASLDGADDASDRRATPATSIGFDLLKHPRKIATFLKVTEDIAFKVIGHMIHSATNPACHRLLRWMAEQYGHYPHISKHKTDMKKLSLTVDDDAVPVVHRDVEPETDCVLNEEEDDDDEEDEDSGRRSSADTDDECENADGDDEKTRVDDSTSDDDDDSASSQSPLSGDRASKPKPPPFVPMTYDEVSQRLFKWPKVRITKPQDDKTREFRRSSRGSTSKRNSDRRGCAGQYLDCHNEPITDHNVIAILQHMEKVGDVAEFPLHGSAESKRRLDKDSASVIEKNKQPKYEYREEIGHLKGGYMQLCFDPNYVLVHGTLETIANDFVAINRNSKLGIADVRAEFEILKTKNMPARLLNMVPMTHREFLPEIERNRTRLWMDPQCVRARNVPVMIPCQEGWYVLIEALLDGPKHIVWKVLRHLCNESTIERSVIVPIPNKRYPETFSVFEARPFPRRLRCANPGFMGTAESDMLPSTMHDREESGIGSWSTSNNRPVIEWGAESDLESTTRFFRENGINADPNDYTDDAIHRRIVSARCDATTSLGGSLKAYPADIIRDIQKFDNAVAAAARDKTDDKENKVQTDTRKKKKKKTKTNKKDSAVVISKKRSEHKPTGEDPRVLVDAT